MPELPEVETIVRRLRDGTSDSPPLPGQTIQQVGVYWEKIVETPKPDLFSQQRKPSRSGDSSWKAK